MYRSAIVLGLYLSFAIAIGAACSPGAPVTPEDDSFTTGGTGQQQTGGSSGTGTSGGTTGGTVSTGGAGGSVTTGGAGGTVTTGGAGGTVSTGGTVGGAGRAAGGSAGIVGTGGTVGGAGRAATGGTGGTVSTGGGAGTGSSTGGGAGTGTGVSCDAAFAVTMDGFVRMPAKGGACWSGYAFGGGDTTSTVTPKDFSKSMGILNMSGTVGSATEANSYAGNVYFGFNVNQKSGASTKSTVTPTGTGITLNCTGCATPPMRVALVVGSKSWCAPLTTGTPVAYTAFKTECWEGGTQVAYAKEAFESIQISIPGGAADATFDLTLTTVTEN